jgi:hypothetical protein
MEDVTRAAYCLLLPGRVLYLSHLLRLKKFRKWGNKDGAVSAFSYLQDAGLGTLNEVGGYSGANTVSNNLHNYFTSVTTSHFLSYTSLRK